MIISFSVFKEKILDGTKKQTIRKYTDKRYKQFCNAKKYQLYWGNPRNGGILLKEVEPDGNPSRIHFERHHGIIGFFADTPEDDKIIYPHNENAGHLANRDGFYSNEEMANWFYKKYEEKLFEEKFMVIRWK